jgi:hypothetical protein
VEPSFKFRDFWRSFDRVLDFSLLPSRLFSVLIRTWRTGREVTGDRLRGAQFIEFVTCFFELVVRSAWVLGSGCKGFVGQSASKSRTVRGRQTVRSEPSDGPFFVGSYWRFRLKFRTVRLVLADSPPPPRGQSAPPLRTVRLWLVALVKCFGSLIFASAS